MQEFFRKFSVVVSDAVGSIWASLIVLSLVSSTGWYFDFSDAWKGNISFFSTLAAILLLFFLQKSQNHSDKATHLKLDELIQAVEGARNETISAENQTEKNINKLKRASSISSE